MILFVVLHKIQGVSQDKHIMRERNKERRHKQVMEDEASRKSQLQYYAQHHKGDVQGESESGDIWRRCSQYNKNNNKRAGRGREVERQR